jgi:prepilin-type N-terminal cleavage/methylation domain-containing protein
MLIRVGEFVADYMYQLKSQLNTKEVGMQREKKRFNNQKGFTLIEIIAVLIILGVLAAVAVPKFLGLVEQAEDKALNGAVAAGLSTVSLQYARLTLSNESVPAMSAVAAAAGDNAPASEDFEYTFTSNSSGVNVKAKWKAATNRTGSKTELWVEP